MENLYIVNMFFTDSTTKTLKIAADTIYKAYEQAMREVQKLNKGINKYEISIDERGL